MNRLSVTLESQSTDMIVNGVRIRVAPEVSCEMPVEMPMDDPLAEAEVPAELSDESDALSEYFAAFEDGFEDDEIIDQWHAVLDKLTDEERVQLCEEIMRRSEGISSESADW